MFLSSARMCMIKSVGSSQVCQPNKIKGGGTEFDKSRDTSPVHHLKFIAHLFKVRDGYLLLGFRDTLQYVILIS